MESSAITSPRAAVAPPLLVRIGGVLLGAALAVAGWGLVVVGLISVLVALQVPDPFALGSEPCCGIPDTWQEVERGATNGWLLLASGMTAVVAGVVGIRWARSGVEPRWKRLGLGVGAAWVASAAAIGGAYASLQGNDDLPSCDVLRRSAHRYAVGAEGAAKVRFIRGIEACGMAVGRSEEGLQFWLGLPDQKRGARHHGLWSGSWTYADAGVRVDFEDGFVVATKLDRPVRGS